MFCTRYPHRVSCKRPRKELADATPRRNRAADPGYDVHATKGDHVGHGGRHETHEPDPGHENHADEAGAPLEPGYMTRKADYQRRLRRIEGQVRGINRMVDEEAYCIDILTQVSAVTKALEVVARLVRS